MENVKLNKEKQRKLKGLSKAIYIISKIGWIFCIVGMVGLVIAMITVPAITSNIKVSNNQIKIFGQTVSYERSDNQVIIRDKDDEAVITELDDVKDLNLVFDYLENHDMTKLAIYGEIVFVFALATLIVSFLIFKTLEKLFVNIYKNDTPFTMENVEYIKKIAFLLIGIIVISMISSSVISLVAFDGIEGEFAGVNILYILGLFSLAYIFEYGVEIQKDSNGKIYGDSNE